MRHGKKNGKKRTQNFPWSEKKKAEFSTEWKKEGCFSVQRCASQCESRQTASVVVLSVNFLSSLTIRMAVGTCLQLQPSVDRQLQHARCSETCRPRAVRRKKRAPGGILGAYVFGCRGLSDSFF